MVNSASACNSKDLKIINKMSINVVPVLYFQITFRQMKCQEKSSELTPIVATK